MYRWVTPIPAFLLLIAACISLAQLANASVADRGSTDTRSPKEQVEYLHTQLINQMQNRISYDERATGLETVVDLVFDVQTISRISLGSNWKTLDETQQIQMMDLIKSLIVSNYAARFKKFNGEQFTILSESSVRGSRHLVKSRLKTASGEVVPLDYFLTKRENQWLIYDVTARGVSDLALKRASYGDIFKQKNLTGVLDEIRSQINQNIIDH